MAAAAGDEVVERPAGAGRVDELLFARGRDDEEPPGVEAAADEREEPDAHVVGPVEVLQEEDDRLPLGEAREEGPDGLEKGPVVRGVDRRRRARDLGDEPGQLAPPAREESLENRQVVGDAPAPEGVHPWREGQDLLGLPGAADEHPIAVSFRYGRHFGEEPGLSHAGFADHGEQAPVARADVGERRLEARQLGRAADQRERRRQVGERGRDRPSGEHPRLQAGRPTIELRCRARLRGRPAGHPTAQDRLVESPRPRLGVEPELPLQHIQAHVVLPECGTASAKPDVEAHHGPVDRLLERIQRQQMQRRPERQVGMTLPALVDEETRQRLDGQFAEPLTLDQEPGLERFGLDAQAVQELSPVEP